MRARILHCHNNKAEHLLAVNAAMLKGELLYRNGSFAKAFEWLREAVRLEDFALNYDEPPRQMQSVRHALAALLLEQGVLEEAEREPRAPAQEHLELAEDAGQDADAELARIDNDIADVAQFADFDVKEPCACAGLAIATPTHRA